MHVGALAALLFWMGRKLRFSPGCAIFLVLTLLFAYVAVVEQRPPVLRDLLHSAALAAMVLLLARPLALRDSSFQLTFVAIGCIAGPALLLAGCRTVPPSRRFDQLENSETTVLEVGPGGFLVRGVATWKDVVD